MQKTVTIKDIADKLGVSVSTVSFVLNDKGEISQSTREKIKEAAFNMGYRPDYLARSLVTGRSHTIGVIIPDISNQFFAETVRHIQTELSTYGYDIILCNSEEQAKNDVKYIDWLASRRVDGLILTLSAQSMEEKNHAFIKTALDNAGIPYMFLDRYYNTEAPIVSIDNVDSGYSVTKFLISQGHRNIGVITGPLSLNSSYNRLEGFQKAMEEFGITVDPDNVINLAYDMESGKKGAEKLISKGVTAIFAFNDLQAYGALEYCNDNGLKIPEDVSLVGFDDIFYSSILETKLTTVRQPIKELASKTCRTIINLLEGKDCFEDVKLKTELIVRDSVRNIG